MIANMACKVIFNYSTVKLLSIIRTGTVCSFIKNWRKNTVCIIKVITSKNNRYCERGEQ